jgi:hypothetical protein
MPCAADVVDVNAEYVTIDGEQLYVARRRPSGACLARVLLVGPFALERQSSSITWRRWAEALARAGFEAVSVDPRATGESTGAFEQACFSTWIDDLERVLAHLRQEPGAATCPVLLHGLRVGALLTARLFARGGGDGLLLWDPPSGGRAALLEVLRRRLATDFMEGTKGSHATRDEYVAALKAGEVVEVEGYRWTRRLWDDAESLPLDLPDAAETRAWLLIALNRKPPAGLPEANAVSADVPRPPFWTHAPLTYADLPELFARSLAFLADAAERARGRR